MPEGGRLADPLRIHVQPAPVVGGRVTALYVTPAGQISVLPLWVPSELIAAEMAVWRSPGLPPTLTVVPPRLSDGLGFTGLGLVALSILLVMPVGGNVSVLVREDLAFALAVILLGLLMMITRRNAVTQIVGFMSLENGLVLAATGAKGMPLVVEFSVAFSILIAFIVFGVFVFRIRERFDTVDVGALDQFRGERGERT